MASDSDARDRALLASMETIRKAIGARGPTEVVDAALTTTAELTEPPRSGRAAVAIVLREHAGDPEVLLIRRAERAGDPWSGHMAFPGGREDPRDESLLATALRETREELSLDLTRSGRLLGALRALPAIARGKPTGMLIAPFVFELTEAAPLSYKEDEVSEAVWVPMHPLLHGRLRTTIPYELAGQQLRMPAHDYEGRIVWGLTYRMLDDLFALLR